MQLRWYQSMIIAGQVMKTLLLLSLACLALVSAQQGQKGEPGAPGVPGTCSGSCGGDSGVSRTLTICSYLLSFYFSMKVYHDHLAGPFINLERV